jgi:prepilin-type N-terminal cleavage/methylation domain-containing protein
MTKRIPRGVTLIELMITMIIAASLLTLGLVTMSGYLPKQRLLSAVQQLEGALQRAQSEANAKGFWSCVKFTGSNSFQIWLDNDGNHATGGCGGGTDTQIGQTQVFKDRVNLATGSGCAENATLNCVVWFETMSGLPKRCASSGTCGSVNPGSGCIDSDFQFVLAQADLSTSTRAREVELTAGGLIQSVKPGEKGLITTLWAKIPEVETNGCE